MFDPSCIDVPDYLECLDIGQITKATDKEYRFSCPLPIHATGDRQPSAYMNAETGVFFCHSCKARGNAVTLAADVLDVSLLEVTRMLRQRYSKAGIDIDSRSVTEEVMRILKAVDPPKKKNKIYDEDVLDHYHVPWGEDRSWSKYMFDRGFSLQTLLEWEFGCSLAYNRITLPIRDENGMLVGIKARSWGGQNPKYLNLRDTYAGIEPYQKSLVVFGLDRVYDPDLIIVEGEFNAIAMHQHGYRNTVALNGSQISDRQVDLIKRHAESAILFFDSDPAGHSATDEAAERLKRFIKIYKTRNHVGDPADMHESSIAHCIKWVKAVL